MKLFSKKMPLTVVAIVGAATLFTTVALAGSGGTEFDTALTTVVDWFEGALGKLIAVTTLGVGLAMGIMRQSVMSVVVGAAMALAMNNGPGILQGLVTANLPIL